MQFLSALIHKCIQMYAYSIGLKPRDSNNVCQEQREINGTRQWKNISSDLYPTMPGHLQRGKLIPGFHSA
jgi:hypothetical protein